MSRPIKAPDDLAEILDEVTEGTPHTWHAAAVVAIELGARQLKANKELLTKTFLERQSRKKTRQAGAG